MRRGKCSSHARRGPALRPQHRLYEPADAVVQEHVLLIGSRARPRPVKAPAHNDGRSAAATRTTWQIRKKQGKKPKRPRVLVAALSHVLSCENSVPKLINNHSVFIQLSPVAVSWCFFVEGRGKKAPHLCSTRARATTTVMQYPNSAATLLPRSVVFACYSRFLSLAHSNSSVSCSLMS